MLAGRANRLLYSGRANSKRTVEKIRSPLIGLKNGLDRLLNSTLFPFEKCKIATFKGLVELAL